MVEGFHYPFLITHYRRVYFEPKFLLCFLISYVPQSRRLGFAMKLLYPTYMVCCDYNLMF